MVRLTCAICITNLGLFPPNIFVVRVLTGRMLNSKFRVFAGGFPKKFRKARRSPDIRELPTYCCL